MEQAGLRYAEMIAGVPNAIAQSLRSVSGAFPGLGLDYTGDSLKELGKLAARRNGRPLPDTVIDGIGAYLGETLRVILRGRWVVRFDPTDRRGFRASTLHFNPGVPSHAGFESDVFRVAEVSVRDRNGSLLHEHYAFAKSIMEKPESAPRDWNGCHCRPVLLKRNLQSTGQDPLGREKPSK